MKSQPLQAALDWLDHRIATDPQVGPDLFTRLRDAELERGLLHESRPLCPFLRPHIVSRSTYQAVSQAAQTLSVAFERVVAEALRNDDLLDLFGLTEREARLARIDPGYPWLCVTSRFDSFCTDDGFFFLEYNAETPAGIPDHALMEQILYDLPYLREFIERFPVTQPKPQPKLLAVLLDAYRAWGGTKDKPNIGIIDWHDVPSRSEFFLLKDYFESQGYPTLVGDPHELTYDGATLRCGDFEIDIFYKRVIIHEFLEKFDDTHPLVRAYEDGNVCMVNSFRSKIPHKKAGFAVLSDPEYAHLFTPAQLATIRATIPWTRRVREGRTTFQGESRDLIEILRAERTRLVLKPNDDYGGHGIFIGWESGPAEWEDAIRHALARDYVAQERVPANMVVMPMFSDRFERHELLMDFNPFVFCNAVEGAFIRLSSTALVNISAGGGETPLLILEHC